MKYDTAFSHNAGLKVLKIVSGCGQSVQQAALLRWVLLRGLATDSSCIYRSSNAGLCADFSQVSSLTAGMFAEGAGMVLSQILITPKEKKGTSKVPSVTGITIPDVVPNIKITLKFHGALY